MIRFPVGGIIAHLSCVAITWPMSVFVFLWPNHS